MALPQPGKNYARPDQIRELRAEQEAMRQQLADPVGAAAIENPGAIRRQIRRIDEQVESQRVPEPTAAERTKLAKEARELKEKIRPGMLSDMEMRRAPSGAVDHNIAWQKRNKDRILRLKQIRLALNRDEDRDDVASIEDLRPQSPVLAMRGMQIPGKDFHFGDVESRNHAEPAEADRMISERDAMAEAEARREALFEAWHDDAEGEYRVPCGATNIISAESHLPHCGTCSEMVAAVTGWRETEAAEPEPTPSAEEPTPAEA